MRLPILPGLAALSIALMASGCTTVGGSGKAFLPETTSYAYLPNATQTQLLLRGIPKPSRQVAVAVYSFTDQTGQFKPSATGQTLSRAVSQGGASVLVKALQDVGDRSWFTIVERET